MTHFNKQLARAFGAGVLIGLGLLCLICAVQVARGGEPPIVQANSPEDFFRTGRSQADMLAELHELAALGATQRFAILHTIGGDSNNTNAFNPDWSVNDDFIAMVAATVREGELAGVAFELALFEVETAKPVPQAARLELARAVAESCRDTRTVLNVSEECDLPTADILAIVNAIHEAWPGARVVVHNWPTQSAEAALLTPLVGSPLYGVSGQIAEPGDAARFVDQWGDLFSFAGVAEVGPWWQGFPPDLNDYREQRPALYASLMASGFVGIYYPSQHDQGPENHQRWANAFREARIAAALSTIEDGQTYRPDLGSGSPAIVSRNHDEIRAYHHTGTGNLALGAGEWIVRRFDAWSGEQGGPERVAVPSAGLVPVSAGEALVVARRPAREIVTGEDGAAEANGDGLADVADLIRRPVR